MPESYSVSESKSPRTAALSRPFMVSAYRSCGSGRRRQPDLPDRCLLAAVEPDGRACSIGISFFRRRKTGPAFPLAVCRCLDHGVAFAVYPPGYAPYLRQPMILVDPADEPAPVPGATTAGLSDFEGTIFDAAIAAAAGEAWARTSDPVSASLPDRWWSTQGRKLTAALRMLGISTDLSGDLRARIAHLLGFPVTHLVALSRGLIGYRSRGQAITTVLQRMRRSARLAFDLLTCAWLTRRFGRPSWWIEGRGFRPTAFSGEAMPSGP